MTKFVLGKRLRFLLQLLFSVGALAWIVSSLGAGELLSALGQVTFTFLGWGLVLYILAQLLSAWRWQYMAGMLSFSASYLSCAKLYFLGMFYNLFLPTGYGGDVVRVFYLSPLRKRPSARLATLTVFLDRFFGLLAILFLCVLSGFYLGKEGVFWAELLGGLLIVGIALSLAFLRFISLWKILPRRVRALALLFRAHLPQFFYIGVLSIIVQLLNIVIYLAIFQQLGATLSFAQVAFGYGLVTLATLLPVSVGGLGVREGGWAAILAAFGAQPQLGVSAGLVYFVLQTLASLGGLYPFFSTPKPQASALSGSRA